MQLGPSVFVALRVVHTNLRTTLEINRKICVHNRQYPLMWVTITNKTYCLRRKH